MMLSSFAAREAVHIAAYSHLIETIGMPETVYNEFLQYEAMAEKHDFFHGLAEDQQENIAVKMAAFSAFTEEGIYSDYAKDVIRPSAEECAQNGRARSTKMRWAVRAE